MALMKFGAIVVDGSGKLGGHVFSKNRGGNYLRTKTTPTNPQTPAQTAVRSIFAALSSAWSGLDQAERQSWEDRSAEYARTNIFGDLKNPNGKALFQRLNQNLMLAGEAALDVCPQSASVVSAVVISVNLKTGAPGSDIILGNDLTGSKVIIWASGPVSPGTTFVKNKLRVLEYSDGTALNNVSFDASYTAKYGTPVAGEVVFIAIQTMNANGQKSPRQVFRAVASA